MSAKTKRGARPLTRARRRVLAAALAGACAAGALPAMAAPSDYDVCKIMAFMSPPKDGSRRPADLTLISAHRGLWRDFPENTIQAVQAAYMAGIETVELDVRLDGDGTPVLMHDWALNRTTTGDGFVSDHNTGYVTSLYRRDRFGKDTDFHVPTVEEALIHLARTNQPAGKCQRGYLLILDVKDKHDARAVTSYATALATWNTIRKVQNASLSPINLAQAVAMKVLAEELPEDPDQVSKDFGTIGGEPPHLIPIIYNTTRNGKEIFDRYFSRKPNYLVTFEVVLPYPGIPDSSDWDLRLGQNGWLRTGFSPWDDYPEGTSRGTGACCNLRIPSTQATNPNFTGNWEYLAARGMAMMTSDRPDILNDYLARLGRRNLSHIKVGASQ